MSGVAYNSSSWGWQVRQGWQQLSEWVEYRLSRTNVDLPEWRWPDWLSGWWPDWALPLEVGQVLFWGAVSVLLIWLCWLLFRALEPSIARWLAREQTWVSLGGRSADEAEAEHPAQYWWQQAQLQSQQGSYGEACKALYKGTLQQLHDSQRLLHKSSRTDGEYLETLGQDRPIPRPYQLLIGTHERLVFGSAIASAEMFQRCRNAYEELQKK